MSAVERHVGSDPRRRRARSRGLAALAIGLLLVLPAGTSLAAGPERAGTPAPRPAGTVHRHADGSLHRHTDTPVDPAIAIRRGLVTSDLKRAFSGPCAGGYKMRIGGELACTHGPDAAPEGVDVTLKRSVPQLKADLARSPWRGALRTVRRMAERRTVNGETAGLADVIGPTGVPCVGDGVTGKRIQAIYAVSSDKPDRYTSVAPLIDTYVAHMNAAVVTSARATGGIRHLRFVTKPDCRLNVAKAVLSPTGDDSFTNMVTELKAQGFNVAGRKYHVWMDANVYCGIGHVWDDDRDTSSNANASSISFARSDNGCWDYAELHEVLHGLGAVQKSAPNATAGYHCTDEYDVMCYSDAQGVQMQIRCQASSNNTLLDCNHDDYFHTNPPAGSYLATHWNVADSPFLHAAELANPNPTPTPTPSPSPTPDQGTTSTKTYTATLRATSPVRTWEIPVGDGETKTRVTFTSSAGTGTRVRVRILDATGATVASLLRVSPVNLTATLTEGAYTWQVSSTKPVKLTLKVTHTNP